MHSFYVDPHLLFQLKNIGVVGIWFGPRPSQPRSARSWGWAHTPWLAVAPCGPCVHALPTPCGGTQAKTAGELEPPRVEMLSVPPIENMLNVPQMDNTSFLSASSVLSGVDASQIASQIASVRETVGGNLTPFGKKSLFMAHFTKVWSFRRLSPAPLTRWPRWLSENVAKGAQPQDKEGGGGGSLRPALVGRLCCPPPPPFPGMTPHRPLTVLQRNRLPTAGIRCCKPLLKPPGQPPSPSSAALGRPPPPPLSLPLSPPPRQPSGLRLGPPQSDGALRPWASFLVLGSAT